MSTALLVLIASLVWVLFLAILYRIEAVRGRRLCCRVLRRWNDTLWLFVYTRMARLFTWWRAKTLQLLLHYLLHHFLKQVLQLVRGSEQRLARVVRHNRRRAKRLQIGHDSASHLTAIAEHKEANALSEADKRSLKSWQ